ncbi:type II secretion system protein N [Marinobacter halotolerans]|uniref:type II secretion system protein N n=1 Tax=Marinobacter halotolerans TaxID=1569211 RepID=UPI00124493D7|nr:type II secretion system protein N [Marinobacter halotolerans]
MPQISPRLPLLLALAAALAMVFITAWQGYAFWQPEIDASTATGRYGMAERPQTEAKVPDIDLASISLFGSEDQTVARPEQDIEDLPETNLRLVLRGVMAASGDFPGSALVEDSKNQTEAYVVGDELPGNATLRAVRPDRIIIERAGALESLFFPENEDRSGMELATNEDQGEPEYVEQQARPASFPGPDNNPTSDARREEIRQRLEQLRNRLRNN